MSDEFLGDRKKALEESFFAKENERLKERLRAQRHKTEAKQALSEASGIRDDAMLDHLVALDIGPDTWTALSLVPLVEVAWADHALQARERQAILEAAADVTVTPGKPSYALLESWLAERPDGRLLDVWGEYVVGLCARLDESGRHQLREEIMGRARRVAAAAGGVLGWKSVNEAEQAVLDRLERAFE